MLLVCLLIFEAWNLDFQKSLNPLDFACYGNFQSLGYFSRSVCVKGLIFDAEFQSSIIP